MALTDVIERVIWKRNDLPRDMHKSIQRFAQIVKFYYRLEYVAVQCFMEQREDLIAGQRRQ